MTPDELRVLGEDILKNGLTSPIVLWRSVDDKSPVMLLDGRNRLDAIESIPGGETVEVRNVVVLDHTTDPYAYVISANIHRRHLTAEDKRDIIAKLLKAQPEKSDRQIAGTVKTDHKTVGTVRAELEGRGEIPHVEARTDTKGRKQPAIKQSNKKDRKRPTKRGNKPTGQARSPQPAALVITDAELAAVLKQIGHDRVRQCMPASPELEKQLAENNRLNRTVADLESELKILRAQVEPTRDISFQRKLFLRILRDFKSASEPKNLDTNFLFNSVRDDLAAFVNSVAHNALKFEQFDLIYRSPSESAPDDGLNISASLRRAPR